MRLFVALMMVALAWAAEPRIEMAATPAQVAVGASIELTITYAWPAGTAMAEEPDPSRALAALYITRAAPVERTSTGEGERRVFRYTVAAARSGSWALPRLAMTMGGAHVQANAVVVQVGAESAPPHLPEPRPLRRLPPEPPVRAWWWWALGGAAAVVAALLTWWLRRRVVAARIPPADVARAAFARLDLRDGKAAAAGLSLALRTYAGQVGDFDGPGQTPREIGFAVAKAAAFRAEEGRLLVRLLERVDDLRWIPEELPAEHVTPLVHEAQQWLEGREARVRAEAEAAKPS